MTINHIEERVTANYNAHVCIPPAHLAVEDFLLPRKWPAYRFMSPMQATMLFIKTYKNSYKQAVKAHIDRDIADRMTPKSTLKTSSNNAHFTQVWIARQLADSVGLPYDVYLNFCFYFATRVKRRFLPQPNQLVFTDKSERAWFMRMHKAWGENERKLALDRMDVMPEYFIDNDHGLPAQKAFRENLLELGNNSYTHFPTFIGKRVVSLRQLTADQCRLAFNAQSVDAAITSAESEVEDGMLIIHSYEEPETFGLLQSCLGLPAVDRAISDMCNMCSQADLCGRVRDEVASRLVANHGTEDPILAKKRANGRAYTAKSRAKAKAAKIAALAVPTTGAAS